MNNFYVYVNIKGRIIETMPLKVVEIKGGYRNYYTDHYEALYDKQTCAEEKRGGYYRRVLSTKSGVIKNNTLWLEEPDLDRAKSLFYKDVMKKYKTIERKFNAILAEKEQLEK